MSDDTFGSRHEHWHPGEDRAFLIAAIGRVRERLTPLRHPLVPDLAAARVAVLRPHQDSRWRFYGRHVTRATAAASTTRTCPACGDHHRATCLDCDGPIHHPALGPPVLAVRRRDGNLYRCRRCHDQDGL